MEIINSQSKVINIDRWMETNSDQLKPPICNQLIYDGQLKVFLVGGPNHRTDYHINNGEEIIIMIKGDMDLHVIEHGDPRVITIKEGQIFVLPGRIPHSPQRYENTLGLTIERKRRQNELDCLRYYVDYARCDQVLFEKWFHLINLDTDLQPIIEQFKSSIEFSTGYPTKFYDNALTPHPDDRLVSLSEPIHLHDSFKRKFSSHRNKFSVIFPESIESRIGFYGKGKHIVISVDIELFIWFLGSFGKLTIDCREPFELTFNDSMIIERGSFFILESDGPTLIASMKPYESTKN